jgi:hypothetical protein
MEKFSKNSLSIIKTLELHGLMAHEGGLKNSKRD